MAELFPPGSRVAYASDVADALEAAQKHEAADMLRMLCPDPLDLYLFRKETYALAFPLS